MVIPIINATNLALSLDKAPAELQDELRIATVMIAKCSLWHGIRPASTI